MERPTLKLEMALSTKPTETPVWVDVTALIDGGEPVSWNRGRASEFQTCEAGTSSLTLRNNDRRFDPLNSSSPYYGQLLPMRRVRLSTANGDRLFSHYIDGWPQEWRSGPGDRVVRVNSTDAFKALALQKVTGVMPSESPNARITRILDSAAFTTGSAWVLGSAVDSLLGTSTRLGPAGDRLLDTGITVMTEADLVSITALEAIQEAARVEDGIVFVDGSGAVTFHGRTRRMTYQHTGLILGDGTGGEDEIPFEGIEVVSSDELVMNDVVVTLEGDTETRYQATDSTSQLSYFTRSYEVQGLQQVDTNGYSSQGRAGYLLRRYKEPTLRAKSVTVVGEMDERLWGHIIARQLGDVITVRWRPDGQTLCSGEYRIEGMSHEVNQGRWSVTYSLSVADTAVYWVLGVSGHSELTTTTRLTY